MANNISDKLLKMFGSKSDRPAEAVTPDSAATGSAQISNSLNELISITANGIVTAITGVPITTINENTVKNILKDKKKNKLMVLNETVSKLDKTIKDSIKDSNENIVSSIIKFHESFIEVAKSLINTSNTQPETTNKVQSHEDTLNIVFKGINDANISKLVGVINGIYGVQVGDVSNFIQGLQDVEKSLNQFAEIVNNSNINTINFDFLNGLVNLPDITKSEDKLKDIKGNVDNILSYVEDIIKSLNNIDITEVEMKKISNIGDVFEALVNITAENYSEKIDKNKKNISAVGTSLNELGELIAKDLKNVSEEAIESMKYMNTLIDFITKLTSIGDVSIGKQLKLTMFISLMKNYLAKDVVELINTLNTVADKAEGSTKAVQTLNSFIGTLTALKDLSIWKIIKMQINIELLKATVSKSINDLIDELSKIKALTGKGEKSLESINKIIQSITSIGSEDSAAINSGKENIQSIIGFIEIDVKKLIDNINKIDITKPTVTKVNNLHDLVIKLADIMALKGMGIGTAMGSSIKYAMLKNYIYTVLSDFDKTNKNSLLSKLTAVKITSADKNKIDAIKTTLDILSSLSKTMSMMGMLRLGIHIGAGAIDVIADSLNSFIQKINSIDEKKIKHAQETVKAFSILMAVSAGILLLGGFLIMRDWTTIIGSIAFAFILKYFIKGVINALNNKNVALSLKSAIGISLLIIAAGGILLMGGMILSQNIKIVLGSFAFAFMLWAFLGGITWVIKHTLNNLSISFLGIIAIAGLIIAAGGLLLMGGYILSGNAGMILQTMLFAATLVVFLGGLFAIIRWAGTNALKMSPLLIPLAVLIVAAGGILLIGGFIISQNPSTILGSWIFAGTLLAFLGGLLGGLKIMFKLFNNKTLLELSKNILAVSALVAICGAVLLAGVYAYTLSGGAMGLIYALGFGTAVLTFMMFLLGGLKVMEKLGLLTVKNVSMNIKTMLKVGALVAISTAVLLAGTWLMSNFPNAWESTLSFAALLLAFTVAMVGICELLKTVDGHVKQATITLLGISLCIAAFAGILYLTHKIFTSIGGGNWLAGIGISLAEVTFLSLVLIGLGLVFAVIGRPMEVLMGASIAMLVMAALPAIAGIELCIAGIAVILFALDWAVKGIIEHHGSILNFAISVGGLTLVLMALGGALIPLGAMGIVVLAVGWGLAAIFGATLAMAVSAISLSKAIKEVGDFNAFKNNTAKLVAAYGEIAQIIMESPLCSFKMAVSMGKVCDTIEDLSEMISTIAEGVRDYAELKVPIYEGTKKVGYRQLNRGDFKGAAENVSTIITTLGGTIIKVYEEHPDMFESGWLSSSPFTKVVKSCGKLGDMISDIADGVKDYANLYYTDYSKSKEGEKKRLTDSDFKEAAKNIKTIITLLGGTIIDTYRANPDMFDSGWFSDSPFEKVMSACGDIGDMISDIADGIKDYANLYYTDNNGKKHHLGDAEILKASQNITKILVGDNSGDWHGLTGTIIDIYNNNKDIFGDDDNIEAFEAIMETMGKGAEFISTTIDIIRDYSNLKVPAGWDPKTGKPTKYLTINDDVFVKASEQIEKIMLGDNKNWFGITGTIINIAKKMEESDLDEDDIKDYMEGLNNGSEFLSTVIDIIKDYSDLKVPNKWDPKTGKPIGYLTINDDVFEKAAKSIDTILFGDQKTWYGLMGTISKIIMGNKTTGTKWMEGVEEYLESMENGADFISNVLGIIKDYAELKIATGYDKSGKATGYRTLNDTDFQNAVKNINLILNGDKSQGWQGVVGTINDVLISKANNTKMSDDAEKYFEACIASTEFLNNILSIVKDYAELRIQKYDKNGKVIEGATRVMNVGDFLLASLNIKNIINGIDGSPWHGLVGTIIEQITLSYIKYATAINSGVLEKYTSAIQPIFTLISDIAQTVKDFANNTIKDPVSGKETLITGTMYEDASKNIIKLMFGGGDDHGIIGTILDKIIESKDKIDPKLVIEYVGAFNSIIGLIVPVGETIKALGEMKIVEHDLNGKVVSQSDLSNVNFEKVIGGVSQIIDTTINVSQKLNNNNVQNNLKKLTDNLQNITTGISSFTTASTNVLSSTNKIKQSFIDNNINYGDVEYFKTLIHLLDADNGINAVISSIRNVFEGGGMLSFEASFDDLEHNVKMFGSMMDVLLKYTDNKTNVTINSYANLANAINSVSSTVDAVSKIDIKPFKNEVIEVDKFVTRVNKIDVKKVNAITNLAKVLINLTNKFGNLNQLVDTLSTDLNGTLLKLIVALNEAKQTIDKTEIIQDERHKKIDKSIELVKQIMEQEMIVNIKQEAAPTTETPTNDGGTNPGASGSSDDSITK